METKNIIFELRTRKGCRRMNWLKRLWLPDRLYRVGRMAKLGNGDHIFKYSLLRPGTVQMRCLYIQILVSMPQCSQNIQAIQIDILKSI